MELATIPSTDISPLSPLKNQLAAIKAENATFHFDMADEKQRKAAASHIDKLRTTKAAIEKQAKAARAGYLEGQRRVIAEEKELVAEVVEMIELHDQPLQAWRAAEEQRKFEIRARIDGMVITADHILGKTAEELRGWQTMISQVDTENDFAEFNNEAFAAKAVALEYLKSAIAAAEKAEADARELEALRAAAEARRIADEQAAAEKAAAQAETERVAREAAEAEVRAKAEAEAKEAEAARVAKAAEEAAATEKRRAEEEAAEAARAHAAALKQAADELEAERARTIAAQEAAAAREAAAVAAEQKRAKQAKEDAERVEAAKAADKEHRRKIHAAIVADMVRAAGVTEEQAKMVVISICGDQIHNLKIVY